MSSQTRELDALAARARNGDGVALTALIEGIQDDVYRLSLRMLWHPHDAEDAAQEVLFRIVTSISTFRGESSFRTWALRVASNHLLNVRRSRIEEQRMTFESFGQDLADGLVDVPAARSAEPDQRLLEEEVKIGCTRGMLLCLDREERLAYILGDVFELRSDEAGLVLDISPAAFRKRLSRARERLRSFMLAHCGLVSDRAACRCARRVTAAVERGRVDPDDLLFAGRGTPGPTALPVLEAVGEMERLHEIAAIHRTHPTAETPERLAAEITSVINMVTRRLLS
jgi:RNA polymerase sigma factor (sigma-70 family)